METIISYMDNMFAALPRSPRIIQLKQDLLSSMEDKYYELKKDGTSENEAVGIVISEFGNIDELMSELEIVQTDEEESRTILSEEQAEEFLVAKKKSGLLIGIGVVLCIIGTALLILFSTLYEDGLLGWSTNAENYGLIAMFVLITVAVGFFIYSSSHMEKYKQLDDEFDLTYQLRSLILQKKEVFSSTYTLSLIVGVCLCVLSPVVLIGASTFEDNASSYGLVIMFVVVAIAVFLFIYYGTIRNSYDMLLKTGDFSKKKKEDNRVIQAITAIIWPIAVIIFLISGFVFNQWRINWIVFPITAILLGVFSSVYHILIRKSS
jgi:hypothetical protein